VPSAVHVAAGSVAGVAAVQRHEPHLVGTALRHARSAARHEHHAALQHPVAVPTSPDPAPVSTTTPSQGQASSTATNAGSAPPTVIGVIGLRHCGDPLPVTPTPG
jgi:hypothetical protein